MNARPSLRTVLDKLPVRQALVDVEIETTTRPRIIGADDKPINPPILLRAAAMLAKTPWAMRQLMKAATALSAVVTAHLENAGLHSAALTSGITSVICGLGEILISWLCKAGNVSAPKQEIDLLQDTQDDEPTQILPPLGLSEAVSVADIVPPRTWVVGWKLEGHTLEQRKYLSSLSDAQTFRKQLIQRFPNSANGYCDIYEPGDELP